MRKIILILSLIFSFGISSGQKIVSDLSEIKKPKNGKLYFSELENRLAIYMNGQYFTFFQAKKDSAETPKPVPPISKEQEIGYWGDNSRILVIYAINGESWLMQRDKDASYYVSRGKNLLDDSRTKLSVQTDKNKLSGGSTRLGGLHAPADFPEAAFLKETGRIKNNAGEYVPDTNVGDTGGGGQSGEKISIPVGVIRWDGYFTTITPDDPIDITKETRYALSDLRTQDQGPFYSSFTADKTINKQYWNQDYKRWEYRPVVANIEFNGDRPGIMEKEIDYALSAGIDYFLFNYYATGATPMARAREQFEALPNKKGLKAAYIMENIGGDPEKEAKLIANSFRQDWYQRIDGKPILVLPAGGSYDFDRVYGIYTTIKAAYGGEVYVILQMMGHSVELAGEVRKRGYSSHTRYMTWGGWNEGDRSHRYIMNKEWEYYQESAKQSVDFSPNLTVSLYQVGAQKSWDGSPDYVYSEKATDAEFEEQISRTATFVKDNAQVKTLILYSWSEFTEGGRTVCPQLRRDGTVDDRILKILSKYTD